MMKFLKPTTLLITIIFLTSIVIGCENASVKTEELESINKETPKEAPKEEVKEIVKGSKQEILAENIKAQSSNGQRNSAPKIVIMEPDNNEIVTGNIFTIWWKAEDSNNDKLIIKLEYKKGGQGWVLIADNEINDKSFIWELGALSNGNYQLRATTTDGRLSAYDTKTFEIKR